MIHLFKKKKILIIAANPKDTNALRLSNEARDIKENLKYGLYRRKFEVVQFESAHATDLISISNENPYIIHFSGHGSTHGFILENENELSHNVSGEDFALFLNDCKSLECIILNSCDSESQRFSFEKVVPFLIDVPGTINNDVAKLFSKGFYRALSEGKSIEKSFLYASVNIGGGNISVYRSLENKKNIDTLLTMPVLTKNPDKIKKYKIYPLFYLAFLSLFGVLFIAFTIVHPLVNHIESTAYNDTPPNHIRIHGIVREANMYLKDEDKIPIHDAHITIPEIKVNNIPSYDNGEFNFQYENKDSNYLNSDVVTFKVTHNLYNTYERSLSIGEFQVIELQRK